MRVAHGVMRYRGIVDGRKQDGGEDFARFGGAAFFISRPCRFHAFVQSLGACGVLFRFFRLFSFSSSASPNSLHMRKYASI